MSRDKKVHRPRVGAEPIKSSKAKKNIHTVSAVGAEQTVPIDSIKPNKYNYNHIEEFTLQKMEGWFKEYGFMVPIVVRSGNEHGPFKDGKKQIIDGEHRWTVAGRVGMKTVLIKDLGLVSDALAKTLTLTLNTRGKANEDELARLVSSIRDDAPELVEMLAFDKHDLAAMFSTNDEDLESLEKMATGDGDDGAPDLETDEEIEDKLSEDDDVASFFKLYDLEPEGHKRIKAKAEKLAKRLRWDDDAPGSFLEHLLGMLLKQTKKEKVSIDTEE